MPRPRLCCHRKLFRGGAGLRLSAVERKVLNYIQLDLPLSQRPFKVLAQKIGVSEENLLKKISELKGKGLIRDFAARVNHKKLGYKSTLVGLRVPEGALEGVAKEIVIYPEVTHCFQRKGEYSLWVVFIYKDGRLKEILNKIADSVGSENILNLKTVKKFKLKTRLNI